MAANEYSALKSPAHDFAHDPLYYEMVTKGCPKCKKTFPLYMFYIDSRRSTGVQSKCSLCQKAMTRAAGERYATSDRSNLFILEKTCYRCKETRPIDFFSKNRQAKDGFSAQCKPCASATFEAWYQKNIEEQRARAKAWYIDNPEKIRHKQLSYALWVAKNYEQVLSYGKERRARQRNAPIVDLTRQQWAFIKWAYKDCCAYCGKKSKKLTQDHIIPLSRGGSHTMPNIVPACRSCNSKKHTGPPLSPVQTILQLGVA